MVLQHRDDVGPAPETVVVHVADVGRPVLVAPGRGEWHLPQLARGASKRRRILKGVGSSSKTRFTVLLLGRLPERT